LQTPEFIEKDTAIAIHKYLIEQFGGSLGVRDEGLLESALAQPQATFFGELLHPTIAEQAAAYLYHLAKNHAFVDGNKRVALGVTEAFLRLNGYNPHSAPKLSQGAARGATEVNESEEKAIKRRKSAF
jgi:death-on-curing protein